KTNKEMVLLNGDVCHIGGFVIVQDAQTLTCMFVARMEEIFQRVGSTAHYSGKPDGVLVWQVDLTRDPLVYRMPFVSLLRWWSVVNALLCTVNTQHNYIPKLTVYQERRRTEQTQPVVQHMNNPKSRLLNTAQMRDAMYLQKFRISLEDLDFDTIIHLSAIDELHRKRTAVEEAVLSEGSQSTTGKSA
ncbi:hypothetical protein B0H34DRAFT_664617, partial [Crassisporium funariophilum]